MRISDWSSDVCSSDLNRKEKDYGGTCRHVAESYRSWRPLRPPDPPLESAHEAVYLRRAQRHPHSRPVADRAALRARARLHRVLVGRRWQGAVRRPHTPGAGIGRGAVRARGCKYGEIWLVRGVLKKKKN